MKRNIDCIGFDAPETTAIFMSDLLSDLQHACPYNSYVNASVKKEPNNYSVAISIKFSYGEFKAIAKSSNLIQAVQHGSNEVATQIQKWLQTRWL
jgi:ribosome-associated translation inhibitor RaiA